MGYASPSARVRAVEVIYGLKNMPRMGWLKRGVPLAMVESVAEHVAMTAVLSLTLASQARDRGLRVDVERALKMSLVHDLAEALTSDVDKDLDRLLSRLGVKKADLAREGSRELLRPLMGGEALELLEDFEAMRSLESKVVRAADVLERLIQGLLYAKAGCARREVYEVIVDGLGQLDDLNQELKGVLSEWLQYVKEELLTIHLDYRQRL